MWLDVRIWAGIATIVLVGAAASWTYFNWRLQILAKQVAELPAPGRLPSDDPTQARLPEQIQHDELRYRRRRRIAGWVGAAATAGQIIVYGIYSGPELSAALLHGIPKTDPYTEAARASARDAFEVRYGAFWSAAFAVGAVTCFLLAQRHRLEPQRFSIRYASYDDRGSAYLRWARRCAVMSAGLLAFAVLIQIASHQEAKRRQTSSSVESTISATVLDSVDVARSGGTAPLSGAGVHEGRGPGLRQRKDR